MPQLTTYDGREHEVIKEGLAEILSSQSTAQNGSAGKSQTVFYNPIQQFNRDLSVLAIRAFAEDLAIIKRLRREKEAQKAKHHGGQRGQKRKRGLEEEKESPRSKGPPVETSSGETHQVLSKEEQGKENEAERVEGVPTEPKAERNMTNGHETAKVAHKPPFRILDALSATGLRALRYAKEIPIATHITANDLSPSATSSIKLNVRYNQVESLVHPITGDARAHMYNCSASTSHPEQRLYQVIDLDPYGTAAPFFDAAVQALSDGGLLCVTCTDAGVFASVGYLEKTFSQYGGLPLKGPQSHEGGLRLILHAIATSAAQYGIAIEPLLSLSIDFYVRVFVRVRKSPAEVKFLASKTMIVYSCDSGCGAWSTQHLAQTKEKAAKNGDKFYSFSLAQAPPTDQYCEQCGFKTHLSGPMWAGPLHNPYFIQKILDMLPTLDKETYGTIPRIEGMLTLAMNETLPDDPSPADNSNKKKFTEEDNDSLPFGSLAPQSISHHPFFILPSHLCKVLHCIAPSDAAFRGALLHLGYRTTRSHTKPGSIVTDAPWSVIWEVMREWVRQHANIKEGTLKEGMAGWAIMQNARESGSREVRRAEEELRKVVEERSGSLGELKTRVEAVLYRIGVVQGDVKTEPDSKSGLPMGDDDGVNAQLNGIADRASTEETATALKKPGSFRREKLDTNTLTINFDEILGKEPIGKRLVRYQVNPRPDWGPMNKASG